MRPDRLRKLCLAVTTGIVLLPCLASAADKQNKWGVAPFLGIYRPDLSVLNDGALKAPFLVSGDVVQPDDSVISEFRMVTTDLPAITSGTNAGLEFQLNLVERHALLISIGTWEGNSSGWSVGEFPLQGTVNDVIYNRKVNISYTDLGLGWKYRVLQRGGVRISTRLSLHELFDFDYRDQNVLLFTEGTAQGFRRIYATESTSTAILMLQTGASAEYFVRDWWSIGLDVGYQFGLDEFVPVHHGIQSDFRAGTDGISTNSSRSFNPPVANLAGRTQYSSASGFEQYRDLEIDMDGWKIALRATVFY